jgi:hypothetical protein
VCVTCKKITRNQDFCVDYGVNFCPNTAHFIVAIGRSGFVVSEYNVTRIFAAQNRYCSFIGRIDAPLPNSFASNYFVL